MENYCDNQRTLADALNNLTSQICEPSVAYNLDNRPNGTYTTEDLPLIPDDVRVELIDGYLFVMEAPTVRHQDVIGELYFSIRSYIKKKKGPCKVILSPVDVRLNKDNRTMVQPDLIVICDPKQNTGKNIYGAPDFVVEVLSPYTSRKDHILKLNKYWKAGVKEYWIIDPKKELVSVYQFIDKDIDYVLNTYTFKDKIPVGIYEDLYIDFSEFDLSEIKAKAFDD